MWSLSRAKSLPLRTKVVATLAGAAALFLATSSLIALRFSERQALDTAAAQARASAATVRSTLELSLRRSDLADARSRLRELASEPTTLSVRVFDSQGAVVLATDSEEIGSRRDARWIPPASEIPREGLLRESEDGEAFVSYLVVEGPSPYVLELRFGMASLRQAMRRAARTVVALFMASVLAIALVLLTLFEREVVEPIHRLDRMLATEPDEGRARDEFARIHASVDRLVQERRERSASQGLVEVGQLAAEMAHEFKRPLAYVHSALDVLQMEYQIDEAESKLIANIEEQLEKVQETMRDLLTLARPLAAASEVVQLPQILDEALLQLSAHPNAKRVRVRRDYAPEATAVLGDSHRLEQAFANLLLNAVEAMPDGGELRVSSRRNGDGRVWVEIQDQGVGMDEGELQAALKPFYSTKATGTGLGLPLVQRIVSAHDGSFQLASERGVGTTARVRLNPVAGGAS